MKEIIKEIIPNKLTDNSDSNIKLIKRKLNIYNLQNESNYSLKDFGIDIIYNRWSDKTSIFYYYKELNKEFNSDKLDLCKDNYHKSCQFLKETLKGCEACERKENPDSIFLFKNDKFILLQDLKSRIFWLSYPIIWSKLKSEFGYKWLEISNLCNDRLEQAFKQGAFTTYSASMITDQRLEQAFKQGAFTTELIDVID